MKHFLIMLPRSNCCSAVVLATGAETPQARIEEVAMNLSDLGVRGTVLFDLLASNGTQGRRFYSIAFDGRSFPDLRFVRVQPDEHTESESNQFLCAHIDEIDLSLISTRVKQEVLGLRA